MIIIIIYLAIRFLYFLYKATDISNAKRPSYIRELTFFVLMYRCTRTMSRTQMDASSPDASVGASLHPVSRVFFFCRFSSYFCSFYFSPLRASFSFVRATHISLFGLLTEWRHFPFLFVIALFFNEDNFLRQFFLYKFFSTNFSWFFKLLIQLIDLYLI